MAAKLFKLAVVSIDRPESSCPAELAVVIEHCVAAIREAGERGADLVLLPEEPDVIAGGEYGEHRLKEHPVFVAFQEQAAKSRIGVIATVSAKVEDVPGDGHANTAFLLNREGKVAGLYRKKHPAANYAARDRVIYPTTEAQRETILKHGNLPE